MEPTTRSSDDELGSRRKQLEDSEVKLRKALPLWHRWEAEYEGLKEEIAALPPNATSEDFLKLSQEYENEVLDKKEINELLGLDKGVLRTPDQVSSLLDRRIEYVQRNVGNVAKQLDDVENKIEQCDFADHALATDREGLPIADIEEELDDNENIISSRITNPDDDKAQLKGVLEKMGVGMHDTDKTKSQTTTVNGSSTQSDADIQNLEITKSDSNQSEQVVRGNSDNSIGPKATDDSNQKRARRRKKSVSFAEGTKAEAPAAPVLKRQHLPFGSTLDPDAQSNLESIIPGTFKTTDRVLELDDDDNIVAASVPHIPENESQEDARKRREMLQYSLSEVGAVVAELDIEEAPTDSDEYSTAESDEDEDEQGMNRGSMISDEYRQEMLKLEDRLQARAMINAGPPKTESHSGALNSQLNGDAMDIESDSMRQPNSSPTSKSVRFDDTINVSPAPDSGTDKTPDTEGLATTAETIPIVSDVITERTTSEPHPTVQSGGKGSRFKTDRMQNPSLSAPNATNENSTAKISRFKASRRTN